MNTVHKIPPDHHVVVSKDGQELTIKPKPMSIPRAKKFDWYFYVTTLGDIAGAIEYNSPVDNIRYDCGNYYLTDEDAIAANDVIVACHKAINQYGADVALAALQGIIKADSGSCTTTIPPTAIELTINEFGLTTTECDLVREGHRTRAICMICARLGCKSHHAGNMIRQYQTSLATDA